MGCVGLFSAPSASGGRSDTISHASARRFSVVVGFPGGKKNQNKTLAGAEWVIIFVLNVKDDGGKNNGDCHDHEEQLQQRFPRIVDGSGEDGDAHKVP